MVGRLALWVAAAFAALILLLVVGIPVPLGPFRTAIESRASDALGREVRIGGLGLVLGIHPRLEIEDLHLAHGHADRPDLLRVERTELKLALLPLIGRRLHIVRAAADGVTARIDPEAFPEGAHAIDPSQESGSAALSAAQWSLDVEELELLDVEFEQHRPDLEPTRASLERLTFVKDPHDALGMVGDRHAAFVMNPTRMSQMREVALSGETMPQKSTYFYPKLLSGLLLRSAE